MSEFKARFDKESLCVITNREPETAAEWALMDMVAKDGLIRMSIAKGDHIIFPAEGKREDGC